jgi:hypothetical protein
MDPGRSDLPTGSGADRPARVVHLVRQANGLEPFRRFLASYAAHPAGADHELILLLKGFPDPDDAKPHLDLAAGLVSDCIQVDDRGFDLNAYLAAAQRLPPGPLCFVNSFSRILCNGWLETMLAAFDQPGVGLVGATGSWGSARSYVRFDLGLGGPYARAFPDRRWARGQFAEHTRIRESASAPAGTKARIWQAPVRKARTAWGMVQRSIGFEGFPAVHVRTNGFVIDRDLVLALRAGPLRHKVQVYRLESGANSITAQVRARGHRVVVAGADGRVYDPDDWPASETLWQGDQRNLLIADNQTDDYASGDVDWRTVLARYAWGAHAAPEPPGARAAA